MSQMVGLFIQTVDSVELYFDWLSALRVVVLHLDLSSTEYGFSILESFGDEATGGSA